MSKTLFSTIAPLSLFLLATAGWASAEEPQSAHFSGLLNDDSRGDGAPNGQDCGDKVNVMQRSVAASFVYVGTLGFDRSAMRGKPIRRWGA